MLHIVCLRSFVGTVFSGWVIADTLYCNPNSWPRFPKTEILLVSDVAHQYDADANVMARPQHLHYEKLRLIIFMILMTNHIESVLPAPGRKEKARKSPYIIRSEVLPGKPK
jgi:hypothetical protein